MASNEKSGKDLVRLNDSDSGKELAPNADQGSIIQLGQNNQLDLSGLTTEQQQQLKVKNAEAMIEVNQKAQELVADAGALNHQLGTMSHHTGEVSEKGLDVTISNTSDNSLGRTEIIMGTSDAAKRGKLSRSQTGRADDHTYLYAGVAVFVVIVIALLMVAMR